MKDDSSNETSITQYYFARLEGLRPSCSLSFPLIHLSGEERSKSQHTLDVYNLTLCIYSCIFLPTLYSVKNNL